MTERITPIAGPAPPTDAPENLAAGTVVSLSLLFAFDVELVVENAAVSGRPYYWVSDDAFTNGGVWIALRGDATTGVGTAPVKADPTLLGGSAHGTYTHRAGTARVIFVVETGNVSNVLRCALIPIQRAYT